MTPRRTLWCPPSGNGHAGGMVQSMVCVFLEQEHAPCPLAPLSGPLFLLLCYPGRGVSPAASSPAAARLNGTAKGERRREAGGYDSSSTLMSSELETTSFFDSDEDDSTSRWGFGSLGTLGREP